MAELTCKTHSVETKSSPCANSILPHTAPRLIKKGCRSDSNDFTRYHQVIQLVPHIMGKYSFILWESIPTFYENTFPQYMGLPELIDILNLDHSILCIRQIEVIQQLLFCEKVLVCIPVPSVLSIVLCCSNGNKQSCRNRKSSVV